MTDLICLSRIITQFPTILTHSGHGIFQYGQYQDCLETPNFKYNLVSLGIGKAYSGLVIALCLPDICNQTIIKKTLSKALQLAKIQFDIYSVTQNIQDYQFPYSPLFFFTLFLIISLFLLVIISSCFYKKQSASKDIWSSFSIQHTIKVFSRKNDSDLNIFNGIRTISMIWVILGHTYLLGTSTPINVFNLSQISSKPFFLLIEGGFLSVDIFFFIGGFFLAFVFLRQKSKSFWKYPISVLQRILRIWPSFIITMLIYYTIFMHLGSGPRWPQTQHLPLMCKNMWRSMFFIDNFIKNGEEQCLVWGWYLQVDFQIFLICLVLLFLYKYNKKMAGLLGILLSIGSCIYNIIYTQTHHQKMVTNLTTFQETHHYLKDVYIKPYARCTPYILGLFVGLAYTQYSQSNKTLNMSYLNQKLNSIKYFFEQRKFFRILFEWIGIGIIVTLIIIPRSLQVGHHWDQIWHSLYLCFSRIFICFGILMLILPALLGVKTSIFRTALDSSICNFLAKISFCTYLIHYIVITQIFANQKYDIYLNISDVFIQFIGILVLSCFFGFLMTITVEIPFSALQKQLFKTLLKNNNKTNSIQSKIVIDQSPLKPINTSLLNINDSLAEQKEI